MAGALASLDISGVTGYNTLLYQRDEYAWVWRSLVACLNGVQEAGGSNPLTQTTTYGRSMWTCRMSIITDAGYVPRRRRTP